MEYAWDAVQGVEHALNDRRLADTVKAFKDDQ